MTEEVNAGSLRELAALYPAGSTLTVADRVVTVPVSGVRHCTQVVQRGMALAAQIPDGDDELIFIDEHPSDADSLLLFALPQLDPQWVASLDAVDKLDLALAWWRVNQDFFVRRLLPARARLQQAAHGVGPTPSTTSNGTATPTPTTIPLPPFPSGSPLSSATNDATAAHA